ncbi:Bifunctional transcriptional activator/DNA repair enzyme Ada [Symmachiella dynata]|uniref:methylated-DNA--[protein]-cysteine S-methyltransferase n=1 Tax=Symmachiella dynata TaxID=2527995 RepID=A0A517ZIR3_9PLAN|nr:methylated-DNA--[protein]-cysteine S-methyltransferase [Symmachiella dynata]QDU42364.1 Bifunctional transcriptional activator/DNA repair enzyme Ada [Symmachiella dynata]
MSTIPLPTDDEMYQALLRSDSEYDGLFFVAVKTTGIFCRPTCTAKKPLQKNVSFFSNTADAIAAGYRACKRCRPLDVAGMTPAWLDALMEQVDVDPLRRWTNQEIRSLGVDPARVNRWFKANHGLTFLSYLRCRRLAGALAQLSVGDDPTTVAYAAGYESLSGFRDAFQKWFGTTPGQIDNGGAVLTVNRIPTPLGPMIAAADNDHLHLLEFADRRMLETQIKRLSARLKCRFLPGDNRLIEQTAREVTEYFSGSRQDFNVPICLLGTPFQQQIWELLLKIPYGETSSYERLAVAAQNPRAHRAVGRANGDNRLAIIIPCHRVVRSDGQLGGYGGGLRRKEWMLRHEFAVVRGERSNDGN